jgi:hypothetical protein
MVPRATADSVIAFGGAVDVVGQGDEMRIRRDGPQPRDQRPSVGGPLSLGGCPELYCLLAGPDFARADESTPTTKPL